MVVGRPPAVFGQTKTHRRMPAMGCKINLLLFIGSTSHHQRHFNGSMAQPRGVNRHGHMFGRAIQVGEERVHPFKIWA